MRSIIPWSLSEGNHQWLSILDKRMQENKWKLLVLRLINFPLFSEGQEQHAQENQDRIEQQGQQQHLQTQQQIPFGFLSHTNQILNHLSQVNNLNPGCYFNFAKYITQRYNLVLPITLEKNNFFWWYVTQNFSIFFFIIEGKHCSSLAWPATTASANLLHPCHKLASPAQRRDDRSA